MKKVILMAVALAASFISVPALAVDEVFNTLAQAEANCPLNGTPIFTAVRPTDPDSIGYITGSSNGKDFISVEQQQKRQMQRPINCTDASCVVTSAALNNTRLGYYGYISGHNIVCFYYYSNAMYPTNAILILSNMGH